MHFKRDSGAFPGVPGETEYVLALGHDSALSVKRGQHETPPPNARPFIVQDGQAAGPQCDFSSSFRSLVKKSRRCSIKGYRALSPEITSICVESCRGSC